MLPTSYTALMNPPFTSQRVDELVELQVLERMHNSLREDETVRKAGSALFLADAFAEFIATSSRLEASYRELQHEVKRLDVELAERNADLKTTLEVVTILAHEVRNPLASMELFAELLESDPESRQQWISNLRAGIRALSATVNNVLAFYGSSPLKLSAVPMAALVTESIELMQPLADQAEIDIDWLNRTHDLVVDGNLRALQQVMLNLISNAIRHTPARGRIVLTLDRNGKQATLEVADNGCGIRAAHIDRLFEPGFSGSGDTCGLGLAVCARIMQQHQGRISVSNLSPTGASFRIELPVVLSGERRA
jgi:two-component system sensor histidine kinase FlrB